MWRGISLVHLHWHAWCVLCRPSVCEIGVLQAPLAVMAEFVESDAQSTWGYSQNFGYDSTRVRRTLLAALNCRACGGVYVRGEADCTAGHVR